MKSRAQRYRYVRHVVSGTRPSPWSPLSLGSSLAAWCRARQGEVFQDTSRTSLVASNGQNVLGVTDISGSGNHLARIVFGGAEATWAANGVATGKPSIVLTQNPLVTGNFGPLQRRTSAVFAVVKLTDRTTAPCVNYASVAGSTPDDFALYPNAYGRAGMETTGVESMSKIGFPLNRFAVMGASFGASSVRYWTNDRSVLVSATPPSTAHEGIGIGSRTALFAGCEVAELVYVNRSLTQAEGAALAAYLLSQYPSIASTPKSVNVVLCGNSMTVGATAGFQSYGHKACADAGIQVEDTYNAGVSGRQTPDITTNFATEVTPRFDATLAAGMNICVIWEATNHIAAGASAATAQAAIQAACEAAQAGGWTVVVGTVIDRSSFFTGGQDAAGFQAAAATFNTWLRSNYATFADAIFDPAAHADLGPAGASLGANFADGTHPSQAGHDLIAGYLQTQLEALT